MQVLDSLIDGPLELADEQEGNELIGMIVRYLRTGEEPQPHTDTQRMAIAMVRPVLEKSRARIEAGSKGGSDCESKPVSKTESKQESKSTSKHESKSTSKQPSKPESKSTSKTVSKPESKTVSKTVSKQPSKQGSDIYSSSSSLSPNVFSLEGEYEGEPFSLPEDEPDSTIPYGKIVDYLNACLGTSYRPTSQKTRRLIRARWSEGFREPEFQAVIDTMHAAWGNDAKMSCYLRPETLFGTKFESYLNRSNVVPKPPGGGVKDAVNEYASL